MAALKNAVSVLRLFSPERSELSVTEVARLLAMPKSTASRLLKAMRQEGLLTSVESSARYRIGHFLLELSAFTGSGSLMELTDAALAAICRETRHGGYVSMLVGSDVLVLRVHLGTEPIRVVTPLGSRSPAFATSTGRALLARLSDDQVRALHLGGLKPTSAAAPKDIAELLKRLDRVRRTGWSEAVDEAIPGVGSVAVSIRDAAHAETFAFCVSFPAHLVSQVERRRLAAGLREAAKAIAAQVNDTFWTRPTWPRQAA